MHGPEIPGRKSGRTGSTVAPIRRALDWLRDQVMDKPRRHDRPGTHRAAPRDPAQARFPKLADGPAVTKQAADAFLEALFADIAAYDPLPRPSLIITGVMRSGKTQMARRLAAQMGLYHLPTDKVRNVTYGTVDDATRQRLIKYLYKRVLLQYPRGVVLEGTAFCDRGITLLDWAQARGIPCFVIGCGTDTAEQKTQAMLRYRARRNCWTTETRSDADLRRMARRLIGRSRDLQQECAARGTPYFDISASRFRQDRKNTLQAIRRQLRAAEADTGASAGMRD